MTDIQVPNYEGASVPVHGPHGFVGVVIRETDRINTRTTRRWRFTAVEPNGRGVHPGYYFAWNAADALIALDNAHRTA